MLARALSLPWIALAIIATSIAIPAVLFARLGVGHADALFSQWLGLSAIVLMGWAIVLATRAPPLQHVFGGVDQMYRWHKWLAVLALLAVVLHDNIDPEIRGMHNALGLGDLGRTLGEQAFDMLIVLIILSVLTFIPYRIWKWTHKLIGVAFILGVAHMVLVDKAFANTSLLGLYVIAFGFAGVFGYALTLLPARIWALPYRYIVEEVTPAGAAVSAVLRPERPDTGLIHRAGSFVFLRAADAHREPHPFTISAAPRDDRVLRVTFKPLGGGTRVLQRSLQSGQAISVSPAFGLFHLRTGRPQVWIAGGVGVTPFVAWAQALPADAPQVHLVHTVRRAADAPHADELHTLAAQKQNFLYTLHVSAEAGRLTAEAIETLAPAPLAECEAAGCGPSAMLRAMRAGLHRRGLPLRRWRSEAFQIRSSVVPGRWAARINALVRRRVRPRMLKG